MRIEDVKKWERGKFYRVDDYCIGEDGQVYRTDADHKADVSMPGTPDNFGGWKQVWFPVKSKA